MLSLTGRTGFRRPSLIATRVPHVSRLDHAVVSLAQLVEDTPLGEGCAARSVGTAGRLTLHLFPACPGTAHVFPPECRRSCKCGGGCGCRLGPVSRTRHAGGALCRSRAAKKRAGPSCTTGPAGRRSHLRVSSWTFRLRSHASFRPHQPLVAGAVREIENCKVRQDSER